MSGIYLDTIAVIRTDFAEKFGVPRQSGRVDTLRGRIVFEPAYGNIEALRGLEGFSHIWLLWGFSLNEGEGWSPTVRPPRLGGNKRMGVFATRSPYRPNPIGLSCVKLESMGYNGEEGLVLNVSGIDMVDGTPIYDIKPYLPSADSIPDAAGGFASAVAGHGLQVEIDTALLADFTLEQRLSLPRVLAEDPRPGYHHDERRYAMDYAGKRVVFTVEDDVLKVLAVEDMGKGGE